MTHPTDDLVLFVGGELPADAVSRIEGHLAACTECAQVVAQMAAVEDRLKRLVFPPMAPVRQRPRLAMLAIVAAASLVLGVAGGMWGASSRTASQESDARPLFMLLFHEPVSERLALDTTERSERGRRMVAWVNALRESGAFVSGEKLRDEAGRVVSQIGVDDQVGRVPDGELLSGYFIITAADYDEATRLARGSPIVDVGGRVSVRALQ